jgi:hypothetical protein
MEFVLCCRSDALPGSFSIYFCPLATSSPPSMPSLPSVPLPGLLSSCLARVLGVPISNGTPYPIPLPCLNLKFFCSASDFSHRIRPSLVSYSAETAARNRLQLLRIREAFTARRPQR